MNLALQARIERRSTPEPNSGCWLWDGSLGAAGYGTLGVGRRKSSAHRVSYSAFKGEIPNDKIVLHRCDTKSCVNPQHLVLGTHSDNARDRASRGRPDSTTEEQRHAWGVEGAARGSWGLGLGLKERLDRLSVFEPNTGCQIWFGTVTKSTGYGELKIEGKKTTAHRASWIAHNGEIPIGMVVMHKCDIRTCINPDHLALGSRKENSVDMARKRRGYFNKITRDQRREMSQRAQQTLGPDGLKARGAARSYKTPEQFSDIASKGWATRRAKKVETNR